MLLIYAVLMLLMSKANFPSLSFPFFNHAWWGYNGSGSPWRFIVIILSESGKESWIVSRWKIQRNCKWEIGYRQHSHYGQNVNLQFTSSVSWLIWNMWSRDWRHEGFTLWILYLPSMLLYSTGFVWWTHRSVQIIHEHLNLVLQLFNYESSQTQTFWKGLTTIFPTFSKHVCFMWVRAEMFGLRTLEGHIVNELWHWFLWLFTL